MRRSRLTAWVIALFCLSLLPASLADDSPPPAGSQGTAADEILASRVAEIRQALVLLSRRVEERDTRKAAIEEEIQRLTDLLNTMTKEEAPEPEDTPSDVREVAFRPPLLKKVEKDTPIALICANQRVRIVDLDEFSDAVDARLKTLTSVLAIDGSMFPAGDYNMRIDLKITGNFATISQTLIERPDRPGETLDEVKRTGSAVRKRIARIPKDSAVVQFAVYPDSYEVLREVRSIVWDSDQAVNWIPLKHGEPVPFGSGGPSAQ